MSQEKVDRYKEQKKNRKKIMKQEKCKRYRYRCCHCTYHRLGRLLHL